MIFLKSYIGIQGIHREWNQCFDKILEDKIFWIPRISSLASTLFYVLTMWCSLNKTKNKNNLLKKWIPSTWDCLGCRYERKCAWRRIFLQAARGEGGEAEAWHGGAWPVKNGKIYQYLFSLSFKPFCYFNCSNYVCSFSLDTASYQEAKLIVNKNHA